MPSPLNQDINAFAPGNSCGPFNLLYMYDMEKKVIMTMTTVMIMIIIFMIIALMMISSPSNSDRL